MDQKNPGETLSKRVAVGGMWVFTLRAANQVLSLIRLIVLARILAPFDFGLMAIAFLTMSTLETFSQTGFQQALIQKKNITDEQLNSAWTVTILRGFVLFCILILIAPHVAAFFDEPKATLIVKVFGLSLLFRAFINIGVVYFPKKLEFNKDFLYQLSGTLADFVVAIIAAVLLENVWALVFGSLAGNFTRFIVSYWVHPFRPRLTVNLGKSKDLVRFGKWIFASSILSFLITQGDDIFVGRLLGAYMLGLYQLAYRISNLPATEISHMIAQVTFPAYSKMQENLSRLGVAYLKVLQFTALLSFPAAALIFCLAPDFTLIFLGDKWLPAVPAMQVLALYGLLRAIGATTGAVFMAVGKPAISTKIRFGQAILLAVLIYPFTARWEIVGTALSVAAYAFIFNLVAVYKVLNIVHIRPGRSFKIIALPMMNSVIMVALIYSAKTFLFAAPGLIPFILMVLGAVLAYLLVAYILGALFNSDSKQLVKEQLEHVFRASGAD